MAWFSKKRVGPIGVDLGTRSIKLVQLSADGTQLLEAARWDLPLESSTPTSDQVGEALRQACDGRRFRGRDAVLCLGWRELSIQNIRVPKGPPGELAHLVRQEAEGRFPFPPAETEMRFLDAGEVRTGDAIRREVIVVACHRPVLEQMLAVIEAAELRPVAVEVEPLALLRCYNLQFRRDADQNRRVAFVHVGNAVTCFVIAQGADVVFMKYIEVGGKHFDEAVARNLKMELPEAWALRRHNGDRRADQQDPEIARSVAESVRPVVERLANEVSLCLRYHNVTFRGQQLARLILDGGEATQSLLDGISSRLNLKCEVADPLRMFEPVSVPGRKTQYGVAVGLALREVATKAGVEPAGADAGT
jgi:type IV pilus assembly protein PilM